MRLTSKHGYAIPNFATIPTNNVAYYGGNEIPPGKTNPTITENTPRKPFIRTAFFAVNTAQGGGSLLGASGHTYGSYGIPHGRDFVRGDETVVPINCFDSAGYDKDYRSFTSKANIDNGTTVFRVNGQSVYPQTDAYSGNYDIIAFRYNGGRQSSEFGHFYQGGSTSYENSANGFAFGEYILFTNTLSLVVMEEIEAYLQYKWYGRRTAGSFAEAASVRVGTGSTLSVTGSDGTLYAQGLTPAGGTIAGNVKLAPGATLTVDVSSAGGVSALTVNGTLTLPATGALALAGTPAALAPGDYPICSATAVTGDVANWTPAQKGRTACTLKLADNVLTLHVPETGMLILLS